MKTAEPVTARTPDRVEALIEEARRHQRRRRWMTGLVVATAVVPGPLLPLRQGGRVDNGLRLRGRASYSTTNR